MDDADAREAGAALAAAGLTAVSRETVERLTRFVELLRQWQQVQNLVGPSALDEIWTRRVADSAQLVSLVPGALRWLDLGSGAGFPGMVLAALLVDIDGAEVHLVESNSRKCAFLREAARIIDAPAKVYQSRIEDSVEEWSKPIDAISARGLAPMHVLADWLESPLKNGAVAYLHKGLDFDKEWRATPHRDRYDLVQHQSRIGPGVIAELEAAGDD